MSKQKSAESSSTSGSAQTWAQPYAQQGAGDVQGVFNQNQPGLQQLTDTAHSQVVSPALQNFQQSQGPANQASGYYGDVLSGKYLNGNPYMGQMIGQTNRDITNNVNSQFEQNGRYGSDAHGYGLARGMADSENALQYQNYGDEMNRMGQAAQGAQGAYQGNATTAMGAIGQTAQLPYAGSSNLANSLGALFNGGNSTSVQYSPNPIWGAIGAGLGAAGTAFSDVRLKTNVEIDHRDPDGLGWYSWNWKSDPKGAKVKGVLAHEVKELRPQAYDPNYRGSGFHGVNYAAL